MCKTVVAVMHKICGIIIVFQSLLALLLFRVWWVFRFQSACACSSVDVCVCGCDIRHIAGGYIGEKTF